MRPLVQNRQHANLPCPLQAHLPEIEAPNVGHPVQRTKRKQLLLRTHLELLAAQEKVAGTREGRRRKAYGLHLTQGIHF